MKKVLFTILLVFSIGFPGVIITPKSALPAIPQPAEPNPRQIKQAKTQCEKVVEYLKGAWPYYKEYRTGLYGYGPNTSTMNTYSCSISAIHEFKGTTRKATVTIHRPKGSSVTSYHFNSISEE